MPTTTVVCHPEIRRRLALACAALAAVVAFALAMAAADAHAAPPHLNPSRGATTRGFFDDTDVVFHNASDKTVSVAVLYYTDICGGWERDGWYKLAPGQEGKLFTTPADHAFFYAEDDRGGSYAGNDGPWFVYDQAFGGCLYQGTSPGGRLVGWRRIATKGSEQRINLN